MELGGDVGADDVLDAYPRGLGLAGLERGRLSACVHCLGMCGVLGRGEATHLEELCHFPSLLLGFGCIFLLYHAQARYGQLELHFELVLHRVSC